MHISKPDQTALEIIEKRTLLKTFMKIIYYIFLYERKTNHEFINKKRIDQHLYINKYI